MKFTAFVLATAAASASAQYNPFAGVNFYGGGASPYPIQYQQQYAYPQQQQYVPYPVQVQPVDPLAWERDCTWINSQNFRAALSRATCGTEICSTPQGNGGGAKRSLEATGGFHVWGTVINRAGRVCAIAYTGQDVSQQFPYGRIQSAKKANTANALSTPSRAVPNFLTSKFVRMAGQYAFSGNSQANNRNAAGYTSRFTGTMRHFYKNFYAFSDDGPLGASNYVPLPAIQSADTRRYGYMKKDNYGGANLNTWDDTAWHGFSMDESPGNLDVHYQGAASNYGEACGNARQDPMCMQKPGGYDYHAGGLALFDAQGVLRGAVGVAGDNDCTNHAIAWKTRDQLQMNYVPYVDKYFRTSPVNQLSVGTQFGNFRMNTDATSSAKFDGEYRKGNVGSKAEDNIAFNQVYLPPYDRFNQDTVLPGNYINHHPHGDNAAGTLTDATGFNPAGGVTTPNPVLTGTPAMPEELSGFQYPAFDSTAAGGALLDRVALTVGFAGEGILRGMIDDVASDANHVPFAVAKNKILRRADGPYPYCAVLVSDFWQTNPTKASLYAKAKP